MPHATAIWGLLVYASSLSNCSKYGHCKNLFTYFYDSTDEITFFLLSETEFSSRKHSHAILMDTHWHLDISDKGLSVTYVDI